MATRQLWGMQNEINAWLTGDRDYQTGLDLLQLSGTPGFLFQILSSGPDAYNTPKLLSAIQALKDSEETLPAAAAPAEPAIFPPAEDTYKPDRNLEKKMRIDALIKQLWKEICHLHGQLSILPEGQKLYECANLIMVKDMKRQDLWDHLHYYDENGTWFDEDPDNKPKPFDLEQDIKNLMSRRAKARKELKKPLPKAKRDYHLGRIAGFDLQIEHLITLRKQ